MGCGAQGGTIKMVSHHVTVSKLSKSERSIRAAILIQQWYRRYVARMETRRRCVWSIFQKLEYISEQDQLKLQSFFGNMLVHYKSLQEDDGPHLDTVKVPDDYDGPHVQLPMTLKGLQTMIVSFKQAKILHDHYVMLILTKVCKLLQSLPNITKATTHISQQITICGDLHGNLDDLLIIFHKNGLPDNDNPYIFNGDFVDRGSYSVEVALILFSLLLLYPSAIFINRGNHEDYIMNIRYGFVDEVTMKYPDNGHTIISLFNEVFRWLPVACLIDGKVLVVHGGISPSTDLKHLNTINRNKYKSLLQPQGGSSIATGDSDKDWRQLFDVLWSDPVPTNGSKPNTMRGGGVYFGPDITDKVLDRNNISLLVRSHECKDEGYEVTHNNKVITIFSSSNYYQHGSNKGAYLKMTPNRELHFVQFLNTNKDGHLKLSLRHRISVIESSAIKELRKHINSNRTNLLNQFQQYDTTQSGTITVCQWVDSMETVLQLGLPWHTLKHQLTQINKDGRVVYSTGLDEFCVKDKLKAGAKITETLYRNRTTIETIFKLIDQDNSGYISMSEFESCCQLLEQVTGTHFPPETVKNMAVAMDINHDGLICFNEFLESFRLCDT
ncbi:serine/threonine-protein phosphatase with EF-hands 1-like isoform X3 [Dysidea avara]|uniref:serine/threonine-protein phosphatase with EF-hands 1-like isoform X3 n=1 Tax=Dysidea avara TaxID=196820 RepID=UPI003320FE3B